MNNLKPVLACALILAATSGQTQASIIFSFTQSGVNVVMQSSGTLDTTKLLSATLGGWNGTGVENNAPPESDIMGSNAAGGIDTAFGFHAGTDTSPWVGGMFTISNFAWAVVGTTQFATYNFTGGVRTPGIGVSAADLVGGLWTPDESWTKAGTFASLGLTPGTYAISDIVTGESITIRIGEVAVPEPATLALLGLGLAGLGFSRRKQ